MSNPSAIPLPSNDAVGETPERTELTPVQYNVLRDAVRLARDQQIARLPVLKERLQEMGHAPDDIRAAVLFWATSVQQEHPETGEEAAFSRHQRSRVGR